MQINCWISLSAEYLNNPFLNNPFEKELENSSFFLSNLIRRSVSLKCLQFMDPFYPLHAWFVGFLHWAQMSPEFRGPRSEQVLRGLQPLKFVSEGLNNAIQENFPQVMYSQFPSGPTFPGL